MWKVLSVLSVATLTAGSLSGCTDPERFDADQASQVLGFTQRAANAVCRARAETAAEVEVCDRKFPVQ